MKVEEPVQDYPLTIHAKKSNAVTYFDLDELKKEELPEEHLLRIRSPSMQDSVHKFWLT